MEWNEFRDFAEFEASIEIFVDEYGNPNSFIAWQAGWRVGMTILGFPASALTCTFEADENGQRFISYTWCDDQDEMNKAYLAETDRQCLPGGWEAAHASFLAMEPLRPRYIQPSQMLQQMIDRETN